MKDSTILENKALVICIAVLLRFNVLSCYDRSSSNVHELICKSKRKMFVNEGCNAICENCRYPKSKSKHKGLTHFHFFLTRIFVSATEKKTAAMRSICTYQYCRKRGNSPILKPAVQRRHRLQPQGAQNHQLEGRSYFNSAVFGAQRRWTADIITQMSSLNCELQLRCFFFAYKAPTKTRRPLRRVVSHVQKRQGRSKRESSGLNADTKR
jgi:hypothetical protein